MPTFCPANNLSRTATSPLPYHSQQPRIKHFSTMKPSTLLLSILPLAIAAPLAEPEPVANIEARQKYAKYGDKSGGYGS